MKKILVTGGAGFIGSHLVDALIDRGYEVLVIDDLSTGRIDNLNSSAKFIKYDLNLIDQNYLTKELLNNVDTIFHCAAYPRVQLSIKDPLISNSRNIDLTLRILVAAKDSGVRRFIYSSSSSIYGDTNNLPTKEDSSPNPMSPYALQKFVGEEYCRLFNFLYGLETVSLRYFNVYGDRMPSEGAHSTVISLFMKQIGNKESLTITNDGNQKRDFTHVKDVAIANILAMESKKVGKGEILNIGSGKNYSINQIADLMGGVKKYGEKRIEPLETLADNSKAKYLLGWNPSIYLEQWLAR